MIAAFDKHYLTNTWMNSMWALIIGFWAWFGNAGTGDSLDWYWYNN